MNSFKTQFQYIHSESVIPSLFYSDGQAQADQCSVFKIITEPCQQQQSSKVKATLFQPKGPVWALTKISHVPKGSVLIDPHTLQPILNIDG